MQATVSIIIPCYNAETWLAATLESALGQTYRPIEILLIDDGSKDRSAEIAESYRERGVRVFRQENKGASAARNLGIRLAQGQYLQFLDADDILDSDKVERQVNLYARVGEDYLVSGEWARFTDRPAQAVFGPYPNYRDLSGVEFLQTFYEQTAMMQPGAWLTSRALVEAAGPWDEKLSLNDDGEYFARVMLTAKGIRFCEKARIRYRSSISGSLSRARGRKAWESLFRSTESTLEQLLAKDRSPRTLAAAAYAWKWTAFEVYPGAPDLARAAEARCKALGGTKRGFPAGPAFEGLAKLLGWRLAKRLRDYRLHRTL